MNDSPDLAAVTDVQQQTWSKGDFSVVANLVYMDAEDLAEALDLVPGERVLDVACGSGNARDRRGPPHPGRHGRRRLRPGAARARPRTRRRRAARDRVRRGRRPGPPLRGRRASTSRCRSSARCSRPTTRRPPPSCCGWSSPAAGSDWPTGPPTAPSARCSKRWRKHAPPPPGVESPLLWGTEEHLRELFGDGISDLRVGEAPVAAAVPLRRPLHRVLPRPTSAPPRRPTKGSGRTASRPSPTTCAPSWSRRTPPETGRWCSKRST